METGSTSMLSVCGGEQKTVIARLVAFILVLPSGVGPVAAAVAHAPPPEQLSRVDGWRASPTIHRLIAYPKDCVMTNGPVPCFVRLRCMAVRGIKVPYRFPVPHTTSALPSWTTTGFEHTLDIRLTTSQSTSTHSGG
jgi:hypothetical protein